MPLRHIAFACLLASTELLADRPVFPFLLPMADSSEVRRAYGASSWTNPSSRSRLEVVTPGALKWSLDTLAPDSTEGFSAKARLELALQRNGRPLDLSQLRSLRFEVRVDRFLDQGLEVQLAGSTPNLGSSPIRKSLSPSGLPDSGQWRTIEIDRFELQPSAPEASNAKTFLESVQVLRLKPRSSSLGRGTIGLGFCDTCLQPRVGKFTLELRNLVLVGIPEIPMVQGAGCENSPIEVIENFADGDTTSIAGTPWIFESDSGRGEDSLASTIHSEGTDQLFEGYAELRGALARRAVSREDLLGERGGPRFATWFDGRRGWNGTAWPWKSNCQTDCGMGSLYGITSLAFRMTLLRGGTHVRGVRLRLESESIPEGVADVLIPIAQFDPARPEFSSPVCVRDRDLGLEEGSLRQSFERLDALSWEVVRAADSTGWFPADSFILAITDIGLHESLLGVRKPSGWRSHLRLRHGGIDLGTLSRHGPVLLVAPTGAVLARAPQGAARLTIPVQAGGLLVLVARESDGRPIRRTFLIPR